jgi:hypothetical protein
MHYRRPGSPATTGRTLRRAAEQARFGGCWWDGAMLLLYILSLGMLAAFTAYTRKVQSTVTTLQKQIPRAAGTIATPPQ